MVTLLRTKIIIRATSNKNVLGEKGRRIRELTSVVQKRFKFPKNSVELYAEKVNNRGLCDIAQAESLRYKFLGFGSKRIMRASPFDNAQSLDPQRAESSRQHVRALNTQFASWVQSQLQNHPDELWEDGLQDYLTHVSDIMDTFRDVLDWLKANGAKAESIPAFGQHSTENKSVFGTNNNATKSQNTSSRNSLPAFGSRSTEDKSVFGTANNTNSQIALSPNNLPAFGLRSTENSSIFGSSNNERKFQNAAKVDSLPAVGTNNNETKFQIPEKSGSAQRQALPTHGALALQRLGYVFQKLNGASTSGSTA
ncbi:hypothetical protein IFM89_024160, partial [Coptis chinensis]